MSQTAEDLLIIYETEAKQWASYLQSVFTGPVSEAGICLFDITTVTSRKGDFLKLSHYACKLLILTKGMLEGLCQTQRFFLCRVLSPSAHVVVLRCGVDSLTPLLERVPLNSDECLQISSEQEAAEYLSTVVYIVKKGALATTANANSLTCEASGAEQRAKQMLSSGADGVTSNVVVIPSRVACGSSVEVFVLLKNEPAGCDCEVELSMETQRVTVKPARWNEHILCIRAPDFPVGNVKLTIYSGGKSVSSAELQYYTNMEELAALLSKVADPVEFMCQALQASSMEKLDQKLSSMLLEGMPTGGFQGLKSEINEEREHHCADVPSLLHFAAQYGFRSISGLLLQCPGAKRALHTANRHGQTPTEIAKSHGHTELHVLLKESLKMFRSGEDNGDASVYEMMCNADEQKQTQSEDKEGEDEDLYAPLDVNDEYDTILKSERAVVIANRPPAPAPRPEGPQVKDSKTPYIVQVFQNKKTTLQGDGDLYSLPSKQARDREGSITSTYDTFVPNQMHGLQQLAELQQRPKEGALSTEEPLEHFGDRQQVEKKVEAKQKEKLNHQRASNINNREGDDSVYDKINIVHHMPSVPVNKSRRESQAAESDFYSKLLKGQIFRKADKR